MSEARKYSKQIPQPPGTKIYVVESADTLAGVAVKFGMTVNQLTKLNRLFNSQIFPGQKLFVNDPNPGKSVEEAASQASANQNDIRKATRKASGENLEIKQPRLEELLAPVQMPDFPRLGNSSDQMQNDSPNTLGQEIHHHSNKNHALQSHIHHGGHLKHSNSNDLQDSGFTLPPGFLAGQGLENLENNEFKSSSSEKLKDNQKRDNAKNQPRNPGPESHSNPMNVPGVIKRTSSQGLSNSSSVKSGSPAKIVKHYFIDNGLESANDMQEDKPLTSPSIITTRTGSDFFMISKEDLGPNFEASGWYSTENGYVKGVIQIYSDYLIFEPFPSDPFVAERGKDFYYTKIRFKDIAEAKHIMRQDAFQPKEIGGEKISETALKIYAKADADNFWKTGEIKIFEFVIETNQIQPILGSIADFDQTPSPPVYSKYATNMLEFFFKKVTSQGTPPISSYISNQSLPKPQSSLTDYYMDDAVFDSHLPKTDQQSQFLQIEHIEMLHGILPKRYAIGNWILVYSTFIHGMTLTTLYEKMRFYQGPSILVAQDNDGYIFGAFSTEYLHQNNHYYGTGESFLFRLEPKRTICPWSHENEYFIFGGIDSLAFGGGNTRGTFGLWLNQNFSRGSSYPCETFTNPTLSKQTDFVCRGIEVWGFGDSAN